MNICEKCKGEGLIGSGENPHLRIGRLVTCDACGGTGKVGEAAAPVAEENVVEPEPVKSEESSAVDNVPLAEAPSDASSDGSADSGADAPKDPEIAL